MSEKRAKVRIRGRVQGVGFRFSTVRRAESLGLSGWVRNTMRGGVEAVFEGEERSVKQMVDWCRQGPRLARVADIDVEYTEPTGEMSGFQVRF
ncbi:MAG: acylphosphatase [Planctomycetota bacterium]